MSAGRTSARQSIHATAEAVAVRRTPSHISERSITQTPASAPSPRTARRSKPISTNRPQGERARARRRARAPPGATQRPRRRPGPDPDRPGPGPGPGPGGGRRARKRRRERALDSEVVHRAIEVDVGERHEARRRAAAARDVNGVRRGRRGRRPVADHDDDDVAARREVDLFWRRREVAREARIGSTGCSSAPLSASRWRRSGDALRDGHTATHPCRRRRCRRRRRWWGRDVVGAGRHRAAEATRSAHSVQLLDHEARWGGDASASVSRRARVAAVAARKAPSPTPSRRRAGVVRAFGLNARPPAEGATRRRAARGGAGAPRARAPGRRPRANWCTLFSPGGLARGNHCAYWWYQPSPSASKVRADTVWSRGVAPRRRARALREYCVRNHAESAARVRAAGRAARAARAPPHPRRRHRRAHPVPRATGR